MEFNTIKVANDAGIGRITLARADKHNAFNAEMIAELIDALTTLNQDTALRLLLLDAEGKNFCAGADLNWMKQQAQMDAAANVADANQLALLFHHLDNLPVPVVMLVQGAAFGGALGLVACADIVIANHRAKFCLSEVKLGLIPATISPYVGRAIGQRQLRRYALSAELINAEQALTLGLVHQLEDDLHRAGNSICAQLLDNSPQALRACKSLLSLIEASPIDAQLRADTAERIAAIRVSDEGQHGLNAFFSKQPPRWQGAKR
ncbi:enoyl-CoA hydratase-related protein [Ferrimonas lipolytica]|uniref:Gamma-carboxygeranoyl-CoA hydratase n=1 Tax=Ferrimonas lipolytica TaxID=2724191 RepID=A0A6H1UCV0_9GAMM|nr:enoyl-CoA hydratase-related protein [Ferrimonas lipolytica]QIZ75632.1 gamma-carboxygeranoyl-CoA hydratase [Ferrimonas lipolytica]